MHIFIASGMLLKGGKRRYEVVALKLHLSISFNIIVLIVLGKDLLELLSISVIMFGLNPTQRSGSRVAEREGVESKV